MTKRITKIMIENEALAQRIVEDDPVAMFASDEEKLIYQHFFLKGMDYKKPKKNNTDECYHLFVDIWDKTFPKLLDFPRDGRHVKSLIAKTKKYLADENKVPDTESSCNMFEYVVTWIKQTGHWCSGKGLSVFDSKYLEVLFEIKHGKKQNNLHQRNSSHIFSDYSHLL